LLSRRRKEIEGNLNEIARNESLQNITPYGVMLAWIN